MKKRVPAARRKRRPPASPASESTGPYVLFGAGSFVSDIFDIIHAHRGRVVQLFLNVPEARDDRTLPLEQRLALAGYDIEVHHSLDEFRPGTKYKYALGCTTVHKDRLVNELKTRFGIRFARLIHPQAILGSNVHIGEGVTVSPGVVVGPNCFLDDFCVIIRSASIGHDVRIGKYSRIGPAAVVAGSSRIGEKTQVNMSASVLDHVHVGRGCIIGAGALVNKDLPDHVVAFGIPAKIVRANNDI